MKTKSAERWIQAGLWALPAAWLLTAWGSLDPQPATTGSSLPIQVLGALLMGAAAAWFAVSSPRGAISCKG